MKALSILQPWAWLIVNGHKPVENRTWKTNFRGQVLIHAGKGLDVNADNDIWNNRHPVTGEQSERTAGLMHPNEWERGGIVGIATITDCVTSFDSAYFEGPFGFVMADAKPCTFVPWRGQLGFFDVPDDVINLAGITLSGSTR